MRVDFYRIDPTEDIEVHDILRRVRESPNDESRTRDIGKVPFRMRELSYRSHVWHGDVVRIRMDDVPAITGRDGHEEDVDLNDDEGLGERTAFRYDPNLRVLAIQVSKSGVAASKWARYLEAIADTSEAIIPVAVESGSASDTIDVIDHVRKIRVRYANATDPSVIVDPLGRTADQIRALSDTAPVIEFTVSMGREEGELPIRWAKRVLREAYQHAKRAVTGDEIRVEKVEVVGTLDSDTLVDLNLLQFFMREEVDVAPERRSRRMSYAARSNGIDECWERRASQLGRMFRRR